MGLLRCHGALGAERETDDMKVLVAKIIIMKLLLGSAR